MRPFLLAVCLWFASLPGARAADPVAELGAFSVFPKADLNKLKNDVLTARGPAMSTAPDLSVQSCYVVPLPPAQTLAALQSWDASRHRELKIYVHGDLPATPSTASFDKLGSAPNNGTVRSLISKTQKMGPDVQVTNDEAKRFVPNGDNKGAFPPSVQTFWSSILAERAQSFAAGGAARQPSYDHTGQNVKPGEELSGLLSQQGKIRQQFAGFLNENGVLGGKGSLKKDLYFELIDVEDEGALTLGSFSSQPVGSGFQAADVTYYASGGYYALLTLYQMWPVEVDGKPATLVWRGDLVSSASLASLHGIEKLASESAMMKDVGKTVKLFKGDTGR